ncbi:hypothetical protein PFMC_06030, partial [Plasmodium falciparum CAMP/Malaysia]
YKQENKPQGAGLVPGAGVAPGVGAPGVTDDSPQSKLEKGEIPIDFLRQMFYTLGDYRDILYSGSKDDNTKSSTYNDILKGDKEIKGRESKIQEQLKSFFSNSGNQSSTGGRNPSSWWNNNAKHIWHGMICALTYKENGREKPQVDPQVQKAFFGDKTADKPGTTGTQNGNPGPLVKPTTQKGTYKETYEYSKVVLKDENSGQKAATASPTSPQANGTRLAEFVTRPAYFRYLEEWGEEFCKERKKRLKQIYKDCRGGEYTSRHNDGDGFDCEKIRPNKNKIFGDFNGSSCATSCSFYKKWIKKKRTEYEKQSNVYDKQKTDATTKSDDTSDNYFVQKLKHDTSIKLFLNSLKNGPCKTNNENKKDNEEDKLDFTNTEETFGHENYCDPCSLNGLKCENSHCGGSTNGNTCNGETVTADAIGKMDNSTHKLDMLVSDNSTTEIKDEGLKEACNGADIFKGIRKEQWKCGKFCDVDVCVLENFNNDIHDKKNVLIRTLFKRWLEYFLQDYIEIQKKLKPCMNDGKESSCRNKCNKKCDCVKKWVEEKEKEWKTIQDRYLKPYKSEDPDDYNVRSFLEDLIPRIALTNDKKLFKTLNEFLKSYACKCSDNSKSDKDDTPKDIVECLLQKLGERATSCQTQHQPSGNKTETECQDPTPEPDDEPLEEENTVEAPKICPSSVEEKKKEEEEETCTPASPEPPAVSPPPSAPSEVQTNQTPEQTPVLKPEEEAPATKEDKAPEVSPPAPAAPAAPADQPLDPTILQTTIPFGIALALTSIALLFLK